MGSKFQQYMQPAQEMFNFRNPASSSRGQYEQLDSVHSSPYLPQTPQPNTAYSSTLTGEHEHEPKWRPATVTSTSPPEERPVVRRFNKLQRRSDIVFAMADLASCFLTLAMESIMVHVLVKFYQTRNIPGPTRTSPWANGTTVWSTYMLAGASLAFFVLSAISLMLTCGRKERKVANITVAVVKVVLHVGVWATVAAFYRIGKTGKDLWGWSCSTRAAEIQYEYVNVLDFEQLCRVQTSSWILSIAEAIVKVGFAIVAFHYQIKASGIKRTIVKDTGVGIAGYVSSMNMN